MGRIKLDFRLCLFSLCVFVLAVIKADSSEKSTSPSSNPNPNVAEDSELPVSVVLERLDALEKRFLEEMNRQFKSSQKNWNDQFKSLKKDLDDMKNDDSSEGSLSLLKPPIRGPRGEKGEKGDSNGLRGSYSMPIRPAAPVPLTTTPAKEIEWKIERPGENWIVAKEISRWKPNGRWGNVQLCPPGKFVTGHKFTYFSHSGLTGIELTCTNKYKTDERENGHLLRIKSADEPEINVIGEEWDIRNRGNLTKFAQGFSLNRRLLERRGSAPEIRKISKNYDMIYHLQNPEASAQNSSGIVTKCPENHAICGLIPMMDAAGFGILSAVGFKCCSICTPEEKWETVHQFNNTESSNETVKFNTTVGLQQRASTLNSTNLNFENAVDSVGISPSDFYKEFSTHLAKSKSTGFDWTAAAVSLGTEETTDLTKTYTCGAQSSCVYRQLVGQCGNVKIPVDKFCNVSVHIGSSIPETCADSNDGGGWTVIQRRSSGPKQDFNRTWTEYVKGFGSPDKNFWMGLENIRELTKNGDQELRIELEDFEGEKRYAKYSSFSISDASDFYRLSISGFSSNSTAGDSMFGGHSINGQRFSTMDKDNDNHPSANCAVFRGGGGWWGKTVPSATGIQWWSWKGSAYSHAKTEMKIRKRKS